MVYDLNVLYLYSGFSFLYIKVTKSMGILHATTFLIDNKNKFWRYMHGICEYFLFYIS